MNVFSILMRWSIPALVTVVLVGCVEDNGNSSRLSPILPGEYIAMKEDNLSTIALRAYGNMDLWFTLLNANPHLSSRPRFDLEAGEVIQIPPEEKLDHSLPKSVFPESFPAEYIIMPGDSLHFIAEGCYGDRELWTRIYDANRNVLSESVREDTRRLIAGEVLRIPAPPKETPAHPKPDEQSP